MNQIAEARDCRLRAPAAIAVALLVAMSTLPAQAQLQCYDIAIPEGAGGALVRGHSVNGPRCFEFTPGEGRGGTIEIVEGNGTMVIEGVEVFVKRHDFEPGPYSYYITISPEPLGGAGGPFALQVTWR